MINTPMCDILTAKEISDFVEKHVSMNRRGTPKDIAKLALFLASDDSSYINGIFFITELGSC